MPVPMQICGMAYKCSEIVQPPETTIQHVSHWHECCTMQGLHQPEASTSGRGHLKHAHAFRTPSRHLPTAARAHRAPQTCCSSASSSAQQLVSPPARRTASGSLGIPPQLLAKPELANVSTRQLKDATRTVVFDDNDSRMAAYENMEVQVRGC